MNFRKCLSLIVVLLLSTLASFQASAYDGTANGKIGQIDVTDNSNFGVRVYMAGYPTMCTGGGNFAYLYNTDSNFNVYVASLITAKAMGSPVTIQSYTVSGYCHIAYLAVGT